MVNKLIGRRDILKQGLMTARSNNVFSIALGLVALLYFIVVVATSVLEAKASFIGMVAIGGFT